MSLLQRLAYLCLRNYHKMWKKDQNNLLTAYFMQQQDNYELWIWKEGNDCMLFNVTTKNPHEELRLPTATVTRDLRNANMGSSMMIYFTTLLVSKTK